MIKSWIQIGDGAVEDFHKRWGFIYLSSDNRFAAPERKRDSTSYAEEAGEHVDPRTVDDVFDYSARFLIETPNKDLVNANSRIRAWNEAVRERENGSDVKRCRTVTFHNDYKRVRIVGIPEVIGQVDEKDFYRRQDGMDCVVVTLTIHVSEPRLCDFDTSSGDRGLNIGISLETDGDSLFVNTSRGLKGNERLALLRRGRKVSEWSGRAHKRYRYWNKSRYRWHVTSAYNPLVLERNKIIGMNRLSDEGGFEMKPISYLIKWDLFVTEGYLDDVQKVVMMIQKAGKSRFLIPCIKGRSAAITYGIAVYDGTRRVSEVVYFKSHVEILKSTEVEDLVEDDDGNYINDGIYRQYLTV